MSKFDALTVKLNSKVIEVFGDEALYRPKGQNAVKIAVVYETRNVSVFDGHTSSVTEQIWFWIAVQSGDLFSHYTPRVGDEIIYNKNGYSVAEIRSKIDRGIWVRALQEQTHTEPLNNKSTKYVSF